MKKTIVEFDGQDMFISAGSRLYRVYPYRPGIYWVDMDPPHGSGEVDTKVMVFDDFGDLVDGIGGARQRQIFRQDLH